MELKNITEIVNSSAFKEKIPMGLEDARKVFPGLEMTCEHCDAETDDDHQCHECGAELTKEECQQFSGLCPDFDGKDCSKGYYRHTNY